ncbi:L,D-transpeptidase [Defluviimonas sp. WL0050]|uniref:L,D-transpeptidase n=1 Tax=Albidovulum litorale TaxID=2984134 RepID=A0ABT2ZSB7_9RHOB|nr:L,D-transpeptidase [Defluviimonas sp. WL0050]MCV2874017.1 L,D-transpeptidase [Defluviimonas sp. WL0050]
MRFLRRLFQLTILTIALGLGMLALYQYRFPAPLPPAPLPPLTVQIDRILIEKAARQLTVFRDGVALRTYPVALGFAPEGDKVRQGDGRTPEGTFRIDRRNAESKFHLSLGINYPQADDLIRASAGGYSPGGDIFIHGQPNAFYGKATLRHDWTEGCIAVSDTEIEELWRITRIGTEVEIRP